MSGGGSVVIAGGGTGGHLMPGLAVAAALREAGMERIAFIGTARGLEARLVPQAGYELDLIRIGGLKGAGGLRRLRTAAQLPAAVLASLRQLRARRAEAVLGIGGYASGPALAAAALARIPVVVLEVNARTGLANRLAAPWVRAAAVNFPQTADGFRRAEVTGIPVRGEFFALPPPPTDAPPLVLVSGGSQGAHVLNAAVLSMAQRAGKGFGFRLLHQTGAADAAACAAAYAGLGGRAEAAPFLTDMAAAMARATLVVCRAGASTLGELAAAGRAAILVPFPAAADQHQLRNAQAYAAAGAAQLLEQRELTPERLAREIGELLQNRPRRAAMETAVRAFAHPDAARRIAALVLEARKKG